MCSCRPGRDFARFRDALDDGNVTEARIAAKALPRVGLVSRWSSSCSCATRTKSGSPGQPSAGRAGTARRRQQGLKRRRPS
jgi:hypothetical protein